MTENEIISLIQKYIPGKPSPYGIGDDAALIKAPASMITTDSLISGIHFEPAFFSPKDIAHKLFEKNLSDIIIKGGKPTWGLLNLHLSQNWFSDKKKITQFVKALGKIFRQHQISLIGGDSSRAQTESFTLTLAGTGKQFISRKNEKIQPGDLIAIEGTPGLSDLAFRKLKKGERLSAKYKAFHTRPLANRNFAQWSHLAVAAIDQSDSLHKSLSILASQNNLVICIETSCLRPHRFLKTLGEKKRTELQITGAEDFSSVAIVKQMHEQQLPKSVAVLGRVIKRQNRGKVLYLRHGRPARLRIHDYEHFS